MIKLKNFFLNYKYEIFIILATLITCLTFLSKVYVEDIALQIDSYYYYKTLISMVEDLDIEVSNNYFDDVYQYNYDIHRSPFSLGKDGKIYPKHSVIAPFLSIPFYWFFRGENNGKTAVLIFIIFNVILIYLLLYLYSVEYFDKKTGIITIILLLFTSPIIVETAFTGDLMIALMILGGLYLLQRNKPVIAGILMGFSVWARLTSLLFIIMLPLLAFKDKGIKKNIVIALLFTLIPLSMFGFFNYRYYGSFFSTSYDNVFCHINGEITVESCKDLHGETFLEGFKRVFIHRNSHDETLMEARVWDGILYQFPLWWLVIPGFILFWRKDRYLTIYTVVSFIIIVIFYSGYGTFHVRYVYPWICLFTLPLGCAVEYILNTGNETTEDEKKKKS